MLTFETEEEARGWRTMGDSIRCIMSEVNTYSDEQYARDPRYKGFDQVVERSLVRALTRYRTMINKYGGGAVPLDIHTAMEGVRDFLRGKKDRLRYLACAKVLGVVDMDEGDTRESVMKEARRVLDEDNK